jgi:undecaprenyl-diphosphatase
VTGAALPALWQRMDHAERALCMRVNRGCRRPALRAFFVGVSRAGDGALWYALIGAIALFDRTGGWRVALLMACTGAVGGALYKCLKTRLVRERPFISHAGILCGTTPLDRYSFPSGHTLHAVSFTILAGAHYPMLLPALVPLALAVAASRVVLGLHYPTDVAAGAAIGATLATTSLLIWSI